MTTAQYVYAMLGNESLWAIATGCSTLLNQANIAHSVCGGVAVCLHGYQRNTAGIDFVVAKSDSSQVKELFEDAEFTWNADTKEFLARAVFQFNS